MENIGFKTKIKGIENALHTLLQCLLSFAIGFTVSKAEFVGEISPFSLSFMAIYPSTGLSVSTYYVGSFLGFITKDFSIYNFKYILANSLLFIVITISGAKRYYTRVYSPIIPSIICFLSGFLFLFCEKINVFSFILLICESVLCGCTSYFVKFCFDSFKRRCRLDSRDIVSFNITLIIIVCAIDNYHLFGVPISFVFIILMIFLTCYYLDSKTAIIFNITLCAIPAIINLNNTYYFILLYLPAVVTVLIAKYSNKHIIPAYLMSYLSVYLTNLFSIPFSVLPAPIISSVIYILIPKNKIEQVLFDYFDLKQKNNTSVNTNKDELCEKYNEVSKNLTKLISNTTIKPIIDIYTENKIKRYLHSNRCKDVKITNFYNESGKQIISICCKTDSMFSFGSLKNKLSLVCNNNFTITEKSTEGNIISCRFEQADNFKVECYALCKPKNGENICGDNVTAFKSPDGNYNIILADGMGSGKDAYTKSVDAITLLKKLLLSGVDAVHAVDTVNSSLEVLKDEIGFSTLDVCSISLNDGKGQFVKCGAYKSYVLRDKKINTIKTGGFPAGLNNDISYATRPFNFTNGDIIVIMSDGVSFADENIQAALLLEDFTEIETLTRRIIDIACQNTPNKLDDDMTVLTAKITKRNVE